MDKIEFRRFTKDNWHSLAGATPFDDGSDPWIGDVMVDKEDGEIAIDREGCEIFFFDIEERLVTCSFPKMTFTIANLLFEKEMTRERIEEIEKAWNECIDG